MQMMLSMGLMARKYCNDVKYGHTGHRNQTMIGLLLKEQSNQNHSIASVLMSTYNIYFYGELKKVFLFPTISGSPFNRSTLKVLWFADDTRHLFWTFLVYMSVLP